MGAPCPKQAPIWCHLNNTVEAAGPKQAPGHHSLHNAREAACPKQAPRRRGLQNTIEAACCPKTGTKPARPAKYGQSCTPKTDNKPAPSAQYSRSRTPKTGPKPAQFTILGCFCVFAFTHFYFHAVSTRQSAALYLYIGGSSGAANSGAAPLHVACFSTCSTEWAPSRYIHTMLHIGLL